MRRLSLVVDGALVGPSLGAHEATAPLLSILRCRAHAPDTLLLVAERGFDLDVVVGPDLWRLVS